MDDQRLLVVVSLLQIIVLYGPLGLLHVDTRLGSKFTFRDLTSQTSGESSRERYTRCGLHQQPVAQTIGL
jgi:hypothetical protein